VGFGPKNRYLGEAAKTQEISNLKNTVAFFTRLAGRSLKDPDVQIEQEYISAPLVDINGQVGVELNYLGKKEQFTATQLMAMFLTKVKQTAALELRLPVSDIVISVPAWYADAQRRAVIDAAEIAGLKVLRLINDSTATALGYGITKTDLPEADQKPRRVTFIDIGHSNYTVSVVEFKKGELAVKSTAVDRHFGGRNFDKALVDHFAKEFKEKFKIDINTNAKARARVSASCEKLKKILSANAQAPISIESLLNDVDVKGMLKREELEELVKPLLERIVQPLEKALAEAKLKPEDIDAIEMTGGTTRVPSIKAAIQQYFGKPLSFTLNQDEAVARGAAFSCAILSPAFRVRDFSVHDIVHYPIEFTWEKSPDIPDEDTSLTVFNKGNVMPSTKILTFYRKQAFDLEARYAKPELLPGKTNPWIGRFSVKGVHADAKDDFMICKLKARVNLHGILNVEQGYYVEEQEVEEPIPEKADEKKDGDVCDSSLLSHDGQLDQGRSPTSHVIEAKRLRSDSVSMDLPSGSSKRHRTRVSEADKAEVSIPLPAYVEDENESLTKEWQAMDTEPKTRKVKKQIRRGDLPLSAGTASLDQASKEAAAEKEQQMFMEDKLVADTEDKKNELESFAYELRNKIDDLYAEFASDQEKEKVRAKCEEVEVSFSIKGSGIDANMEYQDWLYGEGEDTTKAVYVSKIEELRASAGPIIQRYNDKQEEERQAIQKKRDEELAVRKAEEEARKAEQAKRNAEAEVQNADTEMKDAEAPQVEEPDD
jgi:heat shock protein 4